MRGKITESLLAAGPFKDVKASDFRCKPDWLILKDDQYKCTFRAVDQSATPNLFSGDVRLELRRRIDEDPRTGARSEFRYCRIQPSCWFIGPWPFNLRNKNGSIIQQESVYTLDSDRIEDIF